MNSYESLLARVRQVRRRWRAQVLVRGISLFLASAIALMVLGVWGADLFGFKEAAVWAARLLTGGLMLFVAWYFLYLPLRARVSNVQIAQLIEERYPHLEDRLVTAMEFGSPAAEPSGMIDLLIMDALDKTRRVDFSVFLDTKRLAIFGLIGVTAFLALFALLTWGPSFFPYGFSNLYVPWTEASRTPLMTIKLMPGDVEVARGADQLIRAQLIGFDSPDVRLYMQPQTSAQWSVSTMDPDPHGSGFRYLLLDIRVSLRYYVESKGVRSAVHSMNVVDRARVDKIDLTYRFPAYTGMAPQVVEGEGDISALRGTQIDFRIHTNGPAQSARLLFDDQSTLDLVRAGAQEFSGSYALRRSGSYVVQISESNGKLHAGSAEYSMEVIEDAAPTVTIARPMRDVRATSVEEVFSETKAEDDIGIAKLELRYSVNGGPEKAVSLHGGKLSGQAVTGAHTFFLEEFGLQPGDMISYYGKAWDNNSVSGPGTSTSDIYFIQVRPFEQKYIQSQQGATPGGEGQGQGQEQENQEALSKQQKEIISATFNLIRGKERMVSKEYQDGLKSLALVQSRLQAQAQGLVDRFQRRGAEQVDESFSKLSEYLKTAIAEMEKAAVALGAQQPDAAMPQEQKSLQQLLRAESLFREIQVSFATQNSASQGSRSQANAEDLADLFELELNKLKNQYETVQRGEQQARDQKVDEALQRLKELAQRQQQLNERNRMLGQQGRMPSSSSGGGGSQSQQQLMEQAEQLRRQLQRLSRERNSPQLDEASNQLQKAIDEMKKALKDQNRTGAEANAQGTRALQQLDEAMRKLARGQETGLNQGMDRAVSESKKLVEEQGKIRETLDRLAEESRQAAASDEIRRRNEDLMSRKTVLADRVRSLENQIQDLSRQTRKTQKETSSRLSDAAETIQENRLPERITSGNALIQNGFYESQKPREDFIRDGLEDVNSQLEAARNSMGQTREGRVEEAANRARQLAEGLESMQQRVRAMQNGQMRGDRSGSRQDQQGRAGSRQQPGQQRGQGSDQGARGTQEARGQNPQGMQGQRGGQGSQDGRQGQGGEQSSQDGRQGQRGGRNSQDGRQGQGSDPNSPDGRAGRGMEQYAQGARGARGPNPEELQQGRPTPETDARELSRNASGPPLGIGRFGNEEERQLSREFEQRLMDAQELRRFLDRNSTEMENLDKVIESLRRAERDLGNPEQIARLRAAIDSMRKVELDLARDLDSLNQRDKYNLAEENEAPSMYRKLVDEYYRSIAKSK